MSLRSMFDAWRRRRSSLKREPWTHALRDAWHGLAALEDRLLLAADPVLDPFDDLTVLAGSPYHIELAATDADGDRIRYEVTSDNPNIEVFLTPGTDSFDNAGGDRFMQVDVEGFGTMIFELFDYAAPRATDRFAELAGDDFFDGLTFHRILNNFVIQGGDPNGDGSGGSALGDFDDQFDITLQHNRTGLLSMAKSTDDTNNSQFFITEGPSRHLDFNHTIFGLLISGEDVRDAISNVPVGGGGVPLADVVISNVQIIDHPTFGTLRISAPDSAIGEMATITVTAIDDSLDGLSVEQSFTVTIDADTDNGGPFLPDLVGDNEISVDYDDTYTFTLPEAIDVEGDDVTYSFVANATVDGVFMATEGIDIELDPATREITITPTTIQTTVTYFTVRVTQTGGSDTLDTFDSQAIRVTVNGFDTDPVLSPYDDQTLQAGSPLHLELNATDEDGDRVRYEVTSDNPDVEVFLTPGSDSFNNAGGNRFLEVNVTYTLPDGTPRVGTMIFELFDHAAPRATDRIAVLAGEGFYDGLTFHRILDGFVIQGGDPLGTGAGGSDLLDFDDQFDITLQHNRTGLLSMAKSQDDTNNSQFFITEGASRHLDFNHTIFGLLISGEDVREEISGVMVGAGGVPIEDVVMTSVRVIDHPTFGTLRLSASDNAIGEMATITVAAIDEDGVRVEQTFHVTVEADTDNGGPFLPDLNGAGRVEVAIGDSTTFNLPAAIDAEGDDVIYSRLLSARINGVVYNTQDLDVTIDPDTGEVTVTPTGAVAMSTYFTVRVTQVGGSDTQDTFDSQIVEVVITGEDGNQAPILPPIHKIVLENGQPFDMFLNAIDPDGDAVQYQRLLRAQIDGQRVNTSDAINVSLNGKTGRLIVTPLGSFDLDTYFTIRAFQTDADIQGENQQIIHVIVRGGGVTPDEFDLGNKSDNTRAQAVEVDTVGEEIFHSFHTGNDVDWVTFTLDTTTGVKIVTKGPPGGDTFLQLFDANGNLVASDNSGNKAVKQGDYALIHLTNTNPLPPGRYFVRVSNPSGDPFARYVLSVDQLTDRFDKRGNDDTPANAVQADGLSHSRVHSLHSKTDQDYVVFNFQNTVSLTALTRSTNQNHDLRLTIYGPDNPNLVLAMADDGGKGKHAMIVLDGADRLGPGTYWIKADSPIGQINSRYVLDITAREHNDTFDRDGASDSRDNPAPLGDEPDNILVGPGSQGRTIHAVDDVDWASFTVATPSDLLITTLGLTNDDTMLHLFGPTPNGTRLLTMDNNSGQGKYAEITYPNAQPGDYLVRISTPGNQVADIFLLTVTVDPKADDFDLLVGDNTTDDNSPDNAAPIGPVDPGDVDDEEDDMLLPHDGVATQDRSFHEPNDVDWATFIIDDDAILRITTAGDAGGDTRLTLFGPDDMDNQRASNDDFGPNKYSQILIDFDDPARPGQYWVRVDSPTGTVIDDYTLTVDVNVLPDVFDHLDATDDSPDTASTLGQLISDNELQPFTGTASQTHSFHNGEDVDWVTFQVGDWSTLRVATEGDDGGNTLVQLFGPMVGDDPQLPNDATPRAGNGNGGPGNYSLLTLGSDKPLPPGRYWVKVTNVTDTFLDQYTIDITVISLTDEFEGPNPDDTPENAAVIPDVGGGSVLTGNVTSHTFHDEFDDDGNRIRDVDWVRFVIPEVHGPSMIYIETLGSPGGNTVVKLYNSDDDGEMPDQLLTMDTHSGQDFYSLIDPGLSMVFDPGTYFVQVINGGQTRDINYNMLVQYIPLADQFDRDGVSDDTREQAFIQPTDASPVSHTFHNADDVDWAAFEVTEISTVDIRALGVGGGDTLMTLYAADGTVVAMDDDGAFQKYSRITLTNEESLRPGAYFLEIQNKGGNIVTNYDLQVALNPLADQFERDPTQPPQPGPPEGFDNDRLNAAFLPLFSTQVHSFHTTNDTDWVTFFLPASAVVTIDTFGPAGGDTRLLLFGPNDPFQLANRNAGDDDRGIGDYAQLIRRNEARLRPGQYWVRIDSPSGQLLDRYGISIEATLIPQSRR